MTRKYQFGSVERKKRSKGPDVWVYRFTDEQGKRASKIIGTAMEFKTESQAVKGAEKYRIEANSKAVVKEIPFAAVIHKYKLEEMPDRDSTRKFSLPWIKNYIEPRWGSVDLSKIGKPPVEIEDWLKSLSLAPKSRYHIRSLMRLIYAAAMRWGYIEQTQNPLDLVRVKGSTKRLREPIILEPHQCLQIAEKMPRDYRPMVLVAMCLGLRVSEILGLKWSDFDFEKGFVHIQRSVVIGSVDETKTLSSKKVLPIAPVLADTLKAYRDSLAFVFEWTFCNPDTRKPWWPDPIRQMIAKAAREIGIAEPVGWHTFRHTYSSTLRKNGVDIKVQQDLMRHATPTITLGTYTQLPSEDLRQANEQVTRMMLQPASGTIQ